MRMPSPVALLWLAVAVSALPEVLRWWRSRPVSDVRWAVDANAPPGGLPVPAGVPTRTRDDAYLARVQEADDAADLVRMDDDGGGSQMRVAAGPGLHGLSAGPRTEASSLG